MCFEVINLDFFTSITSLLLLLLFFLFLFPFLCDDCVVWIMVRMWSSQDGEIIIDCCAAVWLQ